jgi:uncharacterized protein (TIGR04255 family)
MTLESSGSPGKGRRLGTWQNPPLAYVVSELRISPHYALREIVPRLQGALRGSFPRTIEGSELIIDPSSPPAQRPVWQLISAEATRGVYISTRSLSLHATAYVDFEDFLERWREVLNAIASTGLNPFVERAGLRYMDLVVPSNDREPKEYLIENLRGASPLQGVTTVSSLWGAMFSSDGFALQAHVAAPSPQGMLFAPNFTALQLEKPQIMCSAEQRMQSGKPIGYIDTDCWQHVQKVFDTEVLGSLYTQLHDRVSALFSSLLSDLAVKEWK